MSRVSTRVMLGLAALTLWPALATARGYNRNGAAAAQAARQRMIQLTQAQLAEARQALAMAQSQIADAQGKIDASKARVEGAKSSLDSAKTEEKSSHQTLAQIEAELLAKAGEESEVGKAHAELQVAQEELDAAKKRVLNSDAYRAKIAELADSSERTKLLPQIRKEAFQENGDFVRAQSRFTIAKTRWGQLRSEMVRKSETWMAASAGLRDLQKEENKADIEARNGAMARLPATQQMREAKQVALTAMEVIQGCEMRLRSMGVNPAPPQTAAKKR